MSLLHALCLALLLDDGPGPFNAKVVEFALSRVGQTVGDGECSSLVAEALRYAGARQTARGWGEPVRSLKEARPGDILQFDDCVFVRQRPLPDGSVLTLTFRSPRHAAIITKVRRRGNRPIFTVVQQNVGFDSDEESVRKVVQEGIINLAELRGGTLRAFRPVSE